MGQSTKSLCSGNPHLFYQIMLSWKICDQTLFDCVGGLRGRLSNRGNPSSSKQTNKKDFILMHRLKAPWLFFNQFYVLLCADCPLDGKNVIYIKYVNAWICTKMVICTFSTLCGIDCRFFFFPLMHLNVSGHFCDHFKDFWKWKKWIDWQPSLSEL